MKSTCILAREVTLALLVAGSVLAQFGQAATNDFGPKPFPDRMQWWGAARFGMFIHYGPVSLTGKEISWSRANSNPQCPNKGPTPVAVYDNLYKDFNPTNFSAREWVATGKAAGMKYVVLTAKHCDGFLLWDSKVDDYNIMHTPFRRDLCAELATSVRREKLRLGWYFSPMDWRDPDFRTERNAAFVSRMQGQLNELLRNYGGVDLMWFDWDARDPLYDQTNTYALVKAAQPRIIINNRLDLAKGDNDRMLKSPLADYYTPEQHIGAYDDQRPWETCMTLGRQWSWKPNDQIKPVAEVLAILARTVGGDGNLLLNVGPMPDGRIEPRQVEVLQQVGVWMKRNGESIYGTRGGPWKPTKEVASTRKGKEIFVHILKSTDGSVKLPNIPAKIRSARLVRGGKVAFTQADSGIVINLAADQVDPGNTVVSLKLDRNALSIPALDVAPVETKTK
jgi:alpha-L-fucosidase